ncbi:MAG TPA: signal peptide peptidase SppA [Alphaproteobacteria bacterium]
MQPPPLPPDPDSLIDRRRLKRHLSVWRILAILLALVAIGVGVGRLGFYDMRDHVAVLEVKGIISTDRDRERALMKLADDSRAKALLVRIDSPGGTVVGGESLFRQLHAVAAKKPVVAVMGEMAASGGYMVALAAERIFAREGTITGSIGVILQSADVTGLLAKLGIQPEAIKSAPLKAVPSPLEKLTPEGREATQALVNDMYAMFQDMVAASRNLPPTKVHELADGRVFTGRQALANGLIDQIGGEPEARAWLATRGVPQSLPARKLDIPREDDFFSGMADSMVRALTGKTYLSERLTLDGLVALWHPDFGTR